MKKATLILLAITLFTSCATTPVPKEQTHIEKVFSFTDYSKDQLFLIANQWAVETFRKADSVIEYSDKDSGTIMGKYVYKTSALGMLAAYVVDSARNMFTINVKDGAIRLMIDQSEIHVSGSSVSTWRTPSQFEFDGIKFSENGKEVIDSLENYIKSYKAKNTNW